MRSLLYKIPRNKPHGKPVRFSNGWNPIGPWVRVAMATRYQALGFELEYDEPGIGLQGRYTAEGGFLQIEPSVE